MMGPRSLFENLRTLRQVAYIIIRRIEFRPTSMSTILYKCGSPKTYETRIEGTDTVSIARLQNFKLKCRLPEEKFKLTIPNATIRWQTYIYLHEIYTRGSRLTASLELFSSMAKDMNFKKTCSHGQ